MLPPTFLSLLLPPLLLCGRALAGSGAKGDPCTTASSRLQIGTYQFWSECDTYTYCDGSTSTCALKGCRIDEFPFGYPQDYQHLPLLCKGDEFCPDEQDACQPRLAVGSPCQLNRDDQCEAPPNAAELADTSGRGRNFNGAVCLNTVCMWANVTENEACVVDNTAYIAYGSDGESIDIVSRGNCKTGLYCDSQKLQCITQKNLGDSCDADKECTTFNCMASGKCGVDLSLPVQVGAWVYAVVGMCIVGGMVGTLYTLYVMHQRRRETERERRAQYWREQNAFRQNIMQMRETARFTPLPRDSGRGDSPHSTIYASEDAGLPMLGGSPAKGSGLRHAYSDDGNYSDDALYDPKKNRF